MKKLGAIFLSTLSFTAFATVEASLACKCKMQTEEKKEVDAQFVLIPGEESNQISVDGKTFELRLPTGYASGAKIKGTPISIQGSYDADESKYIVDVLDSESSYQRGKRQIVVQVSGTSNIVDSREFE